MRLWSLHPKHLDTKGLLGLWREALLAKHVLEGKTRGYKNHPQLNRFKALQDPVNAINQYLASVYHEAAKRGYRFDKNKVDWNFQPIKILITNGQFNYEIEHLKNKLLSRDIKKLQEYKKFAVNPIFKIKKGNIESWEVFKKQ